MILGQDAFAGCPLLVALVYKMPAEQKTIAKLEVFQ